MIYYLDKSSPRFFTIIVGTGLATVPLVFLAVQTMPVFGWFLWALTIVAVITGASLWYKNEFERAQQAEDDIRAAAREKIAERSRAEMRRQRAERRLELLAKYAGDQNLVERLVLGCYWDGQTAMQLKDSLGNPADIAASVLKGRRREIWKYHPIGGDRYALWITLEQDSVAHWEERV